MVLASGIGGMVQVAPGVLTGKGAPGSIVGQLGQQYLDTSTSPYTQYFYLGTAWVAESNLTNAILTNPSVVGNLTMSSIGGKINWSHVATTIVAGANSIGTVALAVGTATVATTAVTANSLILLTRQAINLSTAMGALSIANLVAGVSFDIVAETPGTPGTPLAGDLSTILWVIIN